MSAGCLRGFGIRTSPSVLRPEKRPRRIKPGALMPLPAVMWRLDCDQEEVMEMIDEGELLWAFDIRAPMSQRPEIRVLAASVNDYLAGVLPAVESEQAEWQRVSQTIFPAKAVITGMELRRLLNCGRQHQNVLVASKQFRLASGARTGPGGSARIEVSSVKDWLLRRRVL